MQRITLKIYGKVQGVFFRHNARQIAAQLNLTGWAENNPDGTVTIVAEGPEGKLKEFILWAKKGTPPAQVTKVSVRWQKYSGKFNSFSVI